VVGMSSPSRIFIVETGNELLIVNPPRASALRIGFALVGAGIVAYTAFMALSDKSTAGADTFGLLSFVAMIALFAYFLGKDFIWLVFGKETLRLTNTKAVRETRRFLRDQSSLPFEGQTRVEILDHTYPTDEAGLSEVIRLVNANGSIDFGRELSRDEAEAVAGAVERFVGSQIRAGDR
jgi:hypothetical protein